jgi:hypothetical protein
MLHEHYVGQTTCSVSEKTRGEVMLIAMAADDEAVSGFQSVSAQMKQQRTKRRRIQGMKKILVLAVACALVSGAALAVWNAQDVVPAASLLVPYAVVSVDSSDVPTAGYTTLFAIVNTSYAPRIVHLTAWNALSVPVVDWDILLTGYDVWTINFIDLLNGNFNNFDTTYGSFGTAPGGYSYTPTAYGPSANATPTTLPTATWFAALPANCRMPYGPLTTLGATIRRNIRSGQPSIPYQYYNCMAISPQFQANTTWTSNLSAAPLFFYVTADVVSQCTQVFQTTRDYWTGTGYNAAYNVITGDILYFNDTSNYSEMINAVHLEAYPAAAQMAGIRTFYELDLHDRTVFTSPGDWDNEEPVLAATLVDDREPLGSAYAFRYATTPATVVSEVVVWKSAFEYDAGEEWVWACTPYLYYAWNEDELTKSTTGGPSGFSTVQPNAIPFETQAVPLNTDNFPGLVQIKSPTGKGGAGFGWVLINFNGGDFTGDEFNDATSAPYYEAWVGIRFVFGTYSAATEATLMSQYRWNNVLVGGGATVVGLATTAL